MNRIRSGWASVSGFLNRPLFNAKFKTKMHYAQLGLVILIIGLTAGRIATKPKDMPVSRADTLAIVMGIKTLLVLSYQLITTHVERYRRWRNLKLYLIINILEIVFWFVVVIMNFMGISRYCRGTYCGLSWLSALMAMVLMLSSMWTAVVSRRSWKEYNAC